MIYITSAILSEIRTPVTSMYISDCSGIECVTRTLGRDACGSSCRVFGVQYTEPNFISFF